MLDKGWKLLSENAHDQALSIVNQCINSYSEDAKKINDQCVDMMKSAENYGKCIILDVVSQCMFIKFETYRRMQDNERMTLTCEELNKHYFNAWVWDPKGWPWKPAEACKDEMKK